LNLSRCVASASLAPLCAAPPYGQRQPRAPLRSPSIWPAPAPELLSAGHATSPSKYVVGEGASPPELRSAGRTTSPSKYFVGDGASPPDLLFAGRATSPSKYFVGDGASPPHIPEQILCRGGSVSPRTTFCRTRRFGLGWCPGRVTRIIRRSATCARAHACAGNRPRTPRARSACALTSCRFASARAQPLPSPRWATCARAHARKLRM